MIQDYSKKTNEELVEIFKAGDQGAFEALMDNTESMRLKIAQSYSNIPGSELEDLLQEGAMAIVKAAQVYDPSKGAAFTTFLYSHLQRVYQDIFRAETAEKRNPHGMVLSFDQLNDNSEYEEDGDTLGNEEFSVVVADYSLIEIRETLNMIALSGAEDMAIRLWIEGKSKPEIAEIMKVKTPTVHSYINRAGKKLKLSGAFA